MKKIIFLTPSGAWPGFVLAGMDQISATPQSVKELLLTQVNSPEIGLVVLDERLSSSLPEGLLTHLDHQYPGKVTILPSPIAADTSFALEVIRQAIGYHIRIQG
ncbi:MAG: hypothetical protein C0624_08310 [Desulfuromonas sp.]|nr:MAG: hypothetical protein C0624_08310 [Desulfuromonas sp.]